jgi:AAA+ ATPase superfamily predicted ATPase
MFENYYTSQYVKINKMIRFYNREKETALIDKIEQISRESARMTFVVGRRRIGKTSLIIKATEKFKTLYFFVSKKSEALLCKEFQDEITKKLETEIFGNLTTFKDVFGYLMDISSKQSFTVIIDEFQDFYGINPSIYSEMQNIWDSKKNESRINLLLCGSIYSLMSKIFENVKEPLFGRATDRMHVKAFDIKTLKEIMSDYYPKYTNEDLLALYGITGGVAKYVEILVDAKAFTKDEIIDVYFSENSLFLEEGRNVMIDEFGKDYGNYFSILSLIASSKTARTDIESLMGMSVGGYLAKLEKEFSLIEKVKPIFAKPNSRSIKYKITDNFMNFWFRFIYKYRSLIEIRNFEYLKEIVRRDYPIYMGRIMERYFIDKMIQEDNFTNIGTYWEKGNRNEIDIVAVKEEEKRIICSEVKLNRAKINLDAMKRSSKLLVQKFDDYEFEYQGLSYRNM